MCRNVFLSTPPMQASLATDKGDIADHLTFGMSRTEQPDVSDVCGSFYFNRGCSASMKESRKSSNPSAIVVDLPQLSPQLTGRKQSADTKLGSPASEESGIFDFSDSF